MSEPIQALDLGQLLTSIQGEMDRVNGWLEQQLTASGTDEEPLQPLIDHLRRFRGKQLRAAQVLLVAGGCGRVTEDHIVVAGVIEMIHAATLVHDDLLDGATQRRGLDCAHVRWGAHASVLLGDWVYSKAFLRSTELADPTCSRWLARATGAVCRGEIHQNLTRGEFALSREAYLAQVDGKTAALFEAGGRLAAYTSGASLEVQNACARHGLLAGRAFQMVDDLLDLIGEQQRTGKSLGTDWANGKMTLPLLHLRDLLPAAERSRLQALFGNGDARTALLEGSFAEPLAEAIEISREEIMSTLNEACTQLDLLPRKEERQLLVELTRFLGHRSR